MTATLDSSVVDQTLVLTINNPELRNALGPEIYAAGREALIQAREDTGIGSVVITGQGSNFCAGGNLQRLLSNRAQPPQVQADSIQALHDWLDLVRHFPKPVIAAVEGACAGAGFSLAMACDLLVASREAVFVMAYSNVGLSPDGGGSWSLVQALPRQLANEILLLGNRLEASRLAQFGLVNRLSDPGQALGEAMRLAQACNQRAPNVLASIKALVQGAQKNTWEEHLTAEQAHFVANLHHANGLEGIEAFLAKRPARYQ